MLPKKNKSTKWTKTETNFAFCQGLTVVISTSNQEYLIRKVLTIVCLASSIQALSTIIQTILVVAKSKTWCWQKKKKKKLKLQNLRSIIPQSEFITMYSSHKCWDSVNILLKLKNSTVKVKTTDLKWCHLC